MDWYIVVKTINGHRYRYRQKTWREGGRVRTRSEYIGHADGWVARIPRGATTLTLPFAPAEPAGVIAFDPSITDIAFHALTETDALTATWEPAWSAARRGRNLVQRDERIDQLLAALDVMMTDETSGAYYSPNLDILNIPPARCFMTKNGQTATQAYHVVLFHELIHWTLDRKRTARDASDYAKEELVAELGAVILMNHFGIEVGNIMRHSRYFQVWLERAPCRNEAMRHAKTEAARAVRYILERGIIPT